MYLVSPTSFRIKKSEEKLHATRFVKTQSMKTFWLPLGWATKVNQMSHQAVCIGYVRLQMYSSSWDDIRFMLLASTYKRYSSPFQEPTSQCCVASGQVRVEQKAEYSPHFLHPTGTLVLSPLTSKTFPWNPFCLHHRNDS